MKSPKAIIFDGTILKSLGLGMEAYNFALEKVGARPHSPEEIKRFFGRGTDRIFLELLGDEKKALEAYDHFIEAEAKNVGRVVLHTEIRELLDRLKELKIPLGVVTGRHYRDLKLHFDHHGLHEYFSSIIGDNHLAKSKPHPEGILLACSQLGCSPQETYYIGDSVMDMEAANSAGSRAIAALWDQWVDEGKMRDQKPFFVAKTPLQILQLVS